MKEITQKLPNIEMMNSLTDLSGGYIQAYKKELFKEVPKTFEIACHFAERCSYLDALDQNLH